METIKDNDFNTNQIDQDTFFLTEPKKKLEKYPTSQIASLEAVVSGVSEMSQSTLLLKKRKELREIDDALDFMKEEYNQRIEICEERQREFERKKQEMREQVIRFEKFIKENDAKRQRAELKNKMETKLIEQNENKKKQLCIQLEKDQIDKSNLEIKRDRLLQYRTYLELTVDTSGNEYEEINDILNRYATLIEANNDLKRQVKSDEIEMDELRQKIRILERETQNEVLVKNSDIHTYQKKLEKLCIEASQLNIKREKDDRIRNDISKESGQVILSIKNLYNRCLYSMHNKIPPIKEQGMETIEYMNEILKIISERITDLDSIVLNYTQSTTTNLHTNTII